MDKKPEKPKDKYFVIGFVCLLLVIFLTLLALVVTKNTAWFDDPLRFFLYRLRTEELTAVFSLLTNASNKYFIIGACLLLLILPWTRLRFGVPLSAGSLGTIILNSIIKWIIQRPRPEAFLHLVEEDGFSFASGHSVSSMFFYGMAIWLLWHYVSRDEDGRPAPGWTGRITYEAVLGASTSSAESPSSNLSSGLLGSRPLIYGRRTATVLTILLLIPMFLVGVTRIYLGVHFPTDVLAGWCLGLIAIFIEAEIILALERRKQSR